MAIRFRFLKDASDGDRLVFAGNQVDMASLAEWLTALASQPLGESRSLDAAEGFDPRENAAATVLLTDRVKSDASVTENTGNILVDWRISPAGCRWASELLRGLAAAPNGMGHQYLEDSGCVVIVASMNEWTGP